MFLNGIWIVTPIKAQNNECEGCVLGVGEDYENPNYEIVAEKNISTYATSRNLVVDKIYQTTTANKSITLLNCSSSYTIYSHGCALTSFTMVVNFLNGTSYTASNVNTVMKAAQAAAGHTGCSFYWYIAADQYDLEVVLLKTNESGLSSSYYNDVIVTQLDNRLPVIVGLRYSNGNTHYVVVKGYQISGSTYTFYINDPNSGNTYTTLNEFVSNGATIRQLVVYSD